MYGKVFLDNCSYSIFKNVKCITNKQKKRSYKQRDFGARSQKCLQILDVTEVTVLCRAVATPYRRSLQDCSVSNSL